MIDPSINLKTVALLELLSKFTPRDLKAIRDVLAQKIDIEAPTLDDGHIKPSKSSFISLADKNKIDIIGGLPFLLNSQKYFKSNEDIRQFAERFLRIPVTKGNKTRAELIGVIVVGIAELPASETNRIRSVLNQVLAKVKKGVTNNIFLEWEKAINSIEFQR